MPHCVASFSGKFGFGFSSRSWMWIVCRSTMVRPTDRRLIATSSRHERALAIGSGHWLKDISIGTINYRVLCVTKSRGIFRDGIEHRLNIRRRTGDYTQDLTRRGLLLQGRESGWSSWNNRTFSIAITAWSAKVLSRSICLLCKWLRRNLTRRW